MSMVRSGHQRDGPSPAKALTRLGLPCGLLVGLGVAGVSAEASDGAAELRGLRGCVVLGCQT
jgi:hypothetical protein